MSDPRLAKRLFLAAQRDLRALEGMLDREVFAEEIFGFHVQQTAEKALKAWLAALGDIYPYTHDLGILLQRLENRGCEVADFWELLEFNPFAVQFRYDVIEIGDAEIDRAGEIVRLQSLLSCVNQWL
jgi:HEPN domain-containing protein